MLHPRLHLPRLHISRLPLIAVAVSIAACGGAYAVNADAENPADTVAQASASTPANVGPVAATPVADAPFTMTEVGDFDDPWAIAMLPAAPDSLAQALVTEKSGRLMLWQSGGPIREIAGTPRVSYAGQGGLGDVVLAPDFAASRVVYLSWVATGLGGKGAVLGRARLSDDAGALENLTIIWRANPFMSGNGHFGHRIAFGPDGMLYLATGERQAFEPAQDLRSNLGKVLRLNPDGSTPNDNPFVSRADTSPGLTASQRAAMRQIWSYGHRNPLGIAFDADGRLWELEMGPAGGDELNIVSRNANYGYPRVSNGDHYDGRNIPDHAPGDGFIAPALWWNPAMSPGGMIIYTGDAFAAWRGDAFIAALGGEALIHVNLDGAAATQGNRWATDMRLRALAQGATGAIMVLEDGGDRGRGRLFRLTPR